MANKTWIVFYGTQIYARYTNTIPRADFYDFPDGVYIYYPADREKKYWYLKDMTPVLLEDVPKILRAIVLINSL